MLRVPDSLLSRDCGVCGVCGCNTGVQITTLDQLHQTGVLGVLTNVVPMRPSQQKDGVVGVIQFLSVHKRIKIDETVSGTKRLVAKVSELQVILPAPLRLVSTTALITATLLTHHAL